MATTRCSSLNGVVTAISMVNGKVLDIEPMNRACLLKETLKLDNPVHGLLYTRTGNWQITQKNDEGYFRIFITFGKMRTFECGFRQYVSNLYGK